MIFLKNEVIWLSEELGGVGEIRAKLVRLKLNWQGLNEVNKVWVVLVKFEQSW